MQDIGLHVPESPELDNINLHAPDTRSFPHNSSSGQQNAGLSRQTEHLVSEAHHRFTLLILPPNCSVQGRIREKFLRDSVVGVLPEHQRCECRRYEQRSISESPVARYQVEAFDVWKDYNPSLRDGLKRDVRDYRHVYRP